MRNYKPLIKDKVRIVLFNFGNNIGTNIKFVVNSCTVCHLDGLVHPAHHSTQHIAHITRVLHYMCIVCCVLHYTYVNGMTQCTFCIVYKLYSACWISYGLRHVITMVSPWHPNNKLPLAFI